jgi:membrane dipeptidase
VSAAERFPGPVVDLHADLLWRIEVHGKDAWSDCPGEMLDLPRMLRHGPSLQCLTLYTPGDRSGEAATAYAESLHAIWLDLLERGEGRLTWIRSRDELLAMNPAGLSGMLTMEGVSPLRGDLDLLDRFHELGVRSIGPVHNPRNEAGAGCMVDDGRPRGLTEFGRALVRRCAEMGILLDVAHIAPEGFRDLMDEVAALTTPVPVVSTHTGAMACTEHRRNLTDEQMCELAQTGGLVGITLYPPHVDTGRREPPTLDDALDHVEHMTEVCGIDHVALGADMDGFDPPGLPGADSPECYPNIAAGLTARGWSDEDVAKVMGENALRVLAAVLR